jgi:signal transduction histidine kinase
MDELSAFKRIMTLSPARGDQDLVINEILRMVADVVSCDRPLVLLHDADADEMCLYSPFAENGMHVPMSEPSIVRRIFHSGRGEVVNDVPADPDSNPILAEATSARQLAAAPLIVGDQRLGVVAAINSRRGAFTGDDLRILTILSDRAALTIQACQLRADLQRQQRELDGLHRLSRLLTSSDSLQNVIGESVLIVCDLLGGEQIAVLLHDETTDSLVVGGPVVGMEEEVIAEVAVPVSQPSLMSTVYRTGTPLMSVDAANDAWVDPRLRELLGIETMMVVPLSSGPRPIGVLAVINAKKGSFDENDLRFASLLGGRVGSVIEASRGRERERALVHRLREADRTKSEFVSMLAHELKGPMTSVLGFGSALREKWESIEDEKREHMLEIVNKEMQRLARLVNDLLDVSRMEAGTLHYELEPLSMQEVLENILVVHTSLQARHAIVSDVPEHLPKLLGDKDRIRQVMINLLTNATRYSPDGTTITIRAETIEEAAAPMVRVSVTDEGIGIAPEDAERAFTKFSVLPKPAWVSKGTGLGLYITKGIVEAHGGRIWVESESGKGTTIHLTLRIAGDEAGI